MIAVGSGGANQWWISAKLVGDQVKQQPSDQVGLINGWDLKHIK